MAGAGGTAAGPLDGGDAPLQSAEGVFVFNGGVPVWIIGISSVVFILLGLLRGCYRHRFLRSAVPSGRLTDEKKGLQEEEILAIPPRVYDTETDEEGECAVCLEQFQGGDLVKTLPLCGHTFHPHCLDTWLAGRETCPMCRVSLRPSAKSKEDTHFAVDVEPGNAEPSVAANTELEEEVQNGGLGSDHGLSCGPDLEQGEPKGSSAEGAEHGQIGHGCMAGGEQGRGGEGNLESQQLTLGPKIV